MKDARRYTMTTRAETVASTRARILDTAHELFLGEAYEDVTLARIAKEAGVSHQTVLNHFDSKAGVLVATADRIRAETEAARYAATPGDVAGAVHALVGEYERIGDPGFRWAASADRIAETAPFLEDARSSHRRWLEAMFGERLPASAAPRRAALDALHAATDTYTWKLLRRDLRRSRSQTEKIMVDLVVGLLEGAPR